MGRLRDRFDDEASFCRGLEEEFHRVAGLRSRAEEIAGRMVGYRQNLADLDAVVRRTGGSHPLSLEGIRRSLETHVLRGPEIRWRDPPAVQKTMFERYESAAIYGYSFVLDPEWDPDDIALYSLSPHRLDSFRILLVNWWLAPRAKFLCEGVEAEQAVEALTRSFHPLVEKLVWHYAKRGQSEFGPDYVGAARSHLNSVLPSLIERFNFFFKKYDRAGEMIYPRPSIEDRKAATVYSAEEYPISAYLHRHLENEIRSLLNLERRTPRTSCGPYRVEGHEGLVCLRDDVCDELGISDNAIRRHRDKGHITAWRASDFREKIGISPLEPINLVAERDVVDEHTFHLETNETDVSANGETEAAGSDEADVSGRWIEPEPLSIHGGTYWIYDWDSVQAAHSHRTAGGQYRFEKPGPKKAPRPA